MDGLSSLTPKPLQYWGHCTAFCCSLTCFLLSSTYLCLFLSLLWLKALLHTSHNTHWSTRLVVLEHLKLLPPHKQYTQLPSSFRCSSLIPSMFTNNIDKIFLYHILSPSSRATPRLGLRKATRKDILKQPSV